MLEPPLSLLTPNASKSLANIKLTKNVISTINRINDSFRSLVSKVAHHLGRVGNSRTHIQKKTQLSYVILPFFIGSRNSTTSGRGGLWAAANLSGLSTRSSSSQLPEFNGRSASKDMTASVMTNAKQTTSSVSKFKIFFFLPFLKNFA